MLKSLFMNCKICKETSSFDKINSYKHFWYFCKKCNSIFSERKIKRDSKFKYLLIHFLSKVTNQSRVNKLLLNENIEGDNFYQYLNNSPTHTGNYIPDKNFDNKWKNYDQDFIKYLNEHKIDLNSKKILSVSDEPGYIVENLKKFTSLNNIMLTAYEEKTAILMSKKLGCKVKKYDLNKDKLSKITNEKYDLIFFRSTLNFNLDFYSLFDEIKQISKNDTKIIFNFHYPTTGSCLMWMFDDYTIQSMININFITAMIKKYKFKILFSKKVILNPRKHYYNTLFKKLFYYPFYYYYMLQIILNRFFNKIKVEPNSNEISYKLILSKTE